MCFSWAVVESLKNAISRCHTVKYSLVYGNRAVSTFHPKKSWRICIVRHIVNFRKALGAKFRNSLTTRRLAEMNSSLFWDSGLENYSLGCILGQANSVNTVILWRWILTPNTDQCCHTIEQVASAFPTGPISLWICRLKSASPSVHFPIPRNTPAMCGRCKWMRQIFSRNRSPYN